MQVNFVKLSPSKNMTVLITNYIDPVHYSKVARKVVDYEYVNAEQVGFIVAPKKKESLLRLAMSGGEFCGNAVLGAAAYCHYKGLTSQNWFQLETTGVEGTLGCFVVAVTPFLFKAKAEMPRENFTETMEVKLNDRDVSGTVVHMNGISHFLTNDCLSENDFECVMNKITKRIDNKAIGIIPYKKRSDGNYEIKPFVYVEETNARFFEQACGSGSLALGIYLSKVTQERAFSIKQPGGLIEVETGVKNYIASIVRFTVEGTCYID